MPLYDVRCPDHGITEIQRLISEVRTLGAAAFACGVCNGPAVQHFGPEHAHHARIDDAENIGMERTDERTHGVNLGLPGRAVSLGKDEQGRERYGYEPIRSSDLSSNAAIRDYAKSQGLTPADGGRYRTTR